MRSILCWPIAALLATVSVPAEAAWHRAESRHVIVYADAPPEVIARIAREVDQLDGLLRRVTGAGGSSDPDKLEIFLLDDVSTLRGLVPMPEAAGAFYGAGEMGELAVAGLADKNQLTSDRYDYRWPLFHEYSHYFMTRHMGRMQPSWFIEGFASVFESAEATKSATLAFGMQPQSRWIDPSQRWIPLRDVLERTPDTPSAEWNLQFYAQGWLLAHYYYFAGGPRRAELDAYFGRIRAGQPLGELDAFFAGGVAGLEADLKAYFSSAPFAQRLAPNPAAGETSVRVEPLPPGEAELVTLRIRLLSADGYEALDSVLADILPIARRHASDPNVAELAAWAAFLAGEYQTAEGLIDPFFASTSSARMLALKGLLITRHALDEADANSFDPMVLRGRAYIERALKQAPNDPLLIHSMYRSVDAQSVANPTEAIALLERELALSPANESLRFKLAEELIQAERFKRAIDVLRPVANSPHDSRARRKAAAYIQALNKRLATKSS